MIGKLDHGSKDFFGLPASFHGCHGYLGNCSCHRFLALQKSIRVLVNRGRGYTVHIQDMWLARLRSRYRKSARIKPVRHGTFRPLIWFVTDRGDLI